MWMKSMQETHTLQMRMLEDLIDQKANKVLEIVTGLSEQVEDRFAQSDVSLKEMRRDLDALQGQVMQFQDLLATRSGDIQAQALAVMGNIHGDIEAIRNQHHAALTDIQAQKEQHQQLLGQHDKLRRQVLESPSTGPSAQASERHLELQAQVAEVLSDAALLAGQQREQGSQLQELEARVVQHLQQQQNEFLLLRQDVESSLAANSHGESLMDLQRKYEEVSRALEGAVREPRPECQGLKLNGQFDALEAERQERHQQVGELSNCLQEERDERIRTDEELDSRQQLATQEICQAMNAAFGQVKAEMQALADRMLRLNPDGAELEDVMASMAGPKRDACVELAQSLEQERSGRVEGLEHQVMQDRERRLVDHQERDELISENSDQRAEIARAMLEWHQIEQSRAHGDEMAACTTESARGDGHPGFISRLFRRDNAEEKAR